MLALLLAFSVFSTPFFAVERSTLTLAPISAQQFFAGAYYASTVTKDVGFFIIGDYTTGGGTGNISPNRFREYVRNVSQPRVFETSLQAQEVTVSVMPFFNPFIILVASDNPEPSLSRGSDLKFPCIVNATWDCNFDGSTYSFVQKKEVRTGNSNFGPFKLPPNYRYFRVYAYQLGEVANQVTQNFIEFDMNPTLGSDNPLLTYASVLFTVYGY